jgi:NDP-sugar pyrophosphorylase family protein
MKSELIKGMILAAGFGSRMGDIGKQTHKSLLKVNGKTLLHHAILKMIQAGIKEIVINTHHLAEQIIKEVESNDNFGINVQFSHEQPEPLETGGGIKNAYKYLGDVAGFFVYNADVYSELNLLELLAAHQKNPKALATLAVKKRDTQRALMFSSEGKLVGWRGSKAGVGGMIDNKEDQISPEDATPYGFCGIHYISKKIFDYLALDQRAFSIIHSYMRAARSGELIKAYDIQGIFWADVGTPEKYQQLVSRICGANSVQ